MAMFTTIATAAGLAATAAGTAQSFAQASKNNRMQAKAEAEAARALEEAKKTIGVNYMESVGLAKEPYELQREAMLSTGAQALEAAREGERGAPETAARIYALQQQGQQQLAAGMSEDLMNLEKATAAESRAIADKLSGISLAEAEGAQKAARDAEEAAAAATKQGFAGAISMAQQAAAFVPLYEKSQAARALGKAGDSFQQSLSKPGMADYIKTTYGVDMSKAPTDAMKFNDFMTSNFNRQQIENINKLAMNTLNYAPMVGVTGTTTGPLNTNPFMDMSSVGFGFNK